MVIATEKGGYTNTVTVRPVGKKSPLISDSLSAKGAEEFKVCTSRQYETAQPIDNPIQVLSSALNPVLFSREEETQIQRTRRIMGEHVKDLSDQEIESYITKFQHLLNFWLDTFEREIFDNKTLQEVLKEE